MNVERTRAPAIAPPAFDRQILPGLYRRWELEQLIEPDTELHFVAAGTLPSGERLFRVARRPLASFETTEVLGDR